VRLGAEGGGYLYRGHQTFHPELNWADLSTSPIMAQIPTEFVDSIYHKEDSQIDTQHQEARKEGGDEGKQQKQDEDEEKEEEKEKEEERKKNDIKIDQKISKNQNRRRDDIDAYGETNARIHHYSLLAYNLRNMVASPLGLLTPVHLNLEPDNYFNHSILTTYLNWRRLRHAEDCQTYSRCPFRISPHFILLQSKQEQQQQNFEQEKNEERNEERNEEEEKISEKIEEEEEEEEKEEEIEIPENVDEEWIKEKLAYRFAKCTREMADTTTPWASTSARLRDISLTCTSDFFTATRGTSNSYQPLLNATERDYLRNQLHFVCFQQLPWLLHGFPANTTSLTLQQLANHPLRCRGLHHTFNRLLTTALNIPESFLLSDQQQQQQEEEKEKEQQQQQQEKEKEKEKEEGKEGTEEGKQDDSDSTQSPNPAWLKAQAAAEEMRNLRNRMVLFLEWNIELT